MGDFNTNPFSDQDLAYILQSNPDWIGADGSFNPFLNSGSTQTGQDNPNQGNNGLPNLDDFDWNAFEAYYGTYNNSSETVEDGANQPLDEIQRSSQQTGANADDAKANETSSHSSLNPLGAITANGDRAQYPTPSSWRTSEGPVDFKWLNERSSKTPNKSNANVFGEQLSADMLHKSGAQPTPNAYFSAGNYPSSEGPHAASPYTGTAMMPGHVDPTYNLSSGPAIQSQPVLETSVGLMNSMNREFWDQQAGLFNSLRGQMCYGTYEELLNVYPELNDMIWQQLDLWKSRGRQRKQIFDDQPPQQSQGNAEKELSNARRPASGAAQGFDANASSNTMPTGQMPAPSAPAVPQALNSSHGLQGQVPSLLAAVSAKRNGSKLSKFRCARCPREGTANGRNDGIHCTQCFKKINESRQRQIQQAAATIHQQAMPGHTSPRQITVPVSGTNSSAPSQQQVTGGVHLRHNSLAPRNAMDASQSGAVLGASHFNVFPSNLTGHNRQTPAVVPPPREDENEGVDENIDGEQDDQSAEFDLEHKSVEDARNYLYKRPADECTRPDLVNDDWQVVKNEHFDKLCEELYHALKHVHGAAPNWSEEFVIEYYNKHQEAARLAILRGMRTPEHRRTIKAQVMVAIDRIIGVHETGVPRQYIKEVQRKPTSGYETDFSLRCSDRARKFINCVKNNKYIAQDVVHGNDLSELARSPDKYLERKHDNTWTNAFRSRDIELGKLVRDGKATPKHIAEKVALAQRKKKGPKIKPVAAESGPTIPAPPPAGSGVVNTLPPAAYPQNDVGYTGMAQVNMNYSQDHQQLNGPYPNVALANSSHGSANAGASNQRTRSAMEDGISNDGTPAKRTRAYPAFGMDEQQDFKMPATTQQTYPSYTGMPSPNTSYSGQTYQNPNGPYFTNPTVQSSNETTTVGIGKRTHSATEEGYEESDGPSKRTKLSPSMANNGTEEFVLPNIPQQHNTDSGGMPPMDMNYNIHSYQHANGTYAAAAPTNSFTESTTAGADNGAGSGIEDEFQDDGLATEQRAPYPAIGSDQEEQFMPPNTTQPDNADLAGMDNGFQASQSTTGTYPSAAPLTPSNGSGTPATGKRTRTEMEDGLEDDGAAAKRMRQDEWVDNVEHGKTHAENEADEDAEGVVGEENNNGSVSQSSLFFGPNAEHEVTQNAGGKVGDTVNSGTVDADGTYWEDFDFGSFMEGDESFLDDA